MAVSGPGNLDFWPKIVCFGGSRETGLARLYTTVSEQRDTRLDGRPKPRLIPFGVQMARKTKRPRLRLESWDVS